MWQIHRRRSARTALMPQPVAGRAEMAAVTPLCLLLAGGKSRRMGGGDKNLIMLGDRPLLAHVIARAVSEGAPVVITANGDAARFEEFGLPVIADVVDGLQTTPPPIRGQVVCTISALHGCKGISRFPGSATPGRRSP